ncbi:MAG: TylF/MycF/NovP-related O-methyltransferase [bacterium]
MSRVASLDGEVNVAKGAGPATEGEHVSQQPRRSMARQLRVWFGRRLIDRLRWTDGPVHVAYHPDSAYELQRHPEFRLLYDSWIAGNRRGNGGDLSRLYAFILNIKQCLADGVQGDFAELGVWRGNSAAVLAHFAAQNSRRVYLFDTFAGFDARDLRDIDAHRSPQFSETSLDAVRRTVGNDAHTTYVQGFFPDSLTPAAERAAYAVVNLDCDLYAPTKAALEFFYPRMTPGGILFLHDYSSGVWPGVTQAIDEFRVATGEHLVLLPDKSGSAIIRKSSIRAE